MDSNSMGNGPQLRPRQKEFARQYTIDLNGTRAAIRAGYSSRGADVQATRLLGNPRIRAAVETAMADRAKRLEIDSDRVVRELAAIAFADIRNFLKFDRHEVQVPPCKAGGTVRVGLFDKTRALELLGRHLGMFADKTKLFTAPRELIAPKQVTQEMLNQLGP